MFSYEVCNRLLLHTELKLSEGFKRRMIVKVTFIKLVYFPFCFMNINRSLREKIINEQCFIVLDPSDDVKSKFGTNREVSNNVIRFLMFSCIYIASNFSKFMSRFQKWILDIHSLLVVIIYPKLHVKLSILFCIII